MPPHPNIIKIYEIYEEKDEIIIILELMKGKNLYSIIKNYPLLSEKQIFNIFHQIYKAILFLHNNLVIHRDIKPDNIIFSDESFESNVKIVDFSLSTPFKKGEKFNIFCGTPGFIAPEILIEKDYTEKIDVYSLGVVLFTLYKKNNSSLIFFRFMRKPAFYGKNVNEILKKNKECEVSYRKHVWSHYSIEARILVKQMIEKNPIKRIDLKDILLSKWMLKMNYRNLPTTDEATVKKNLQTNNEVRVEALNEEKGIEKPNISMLNPHFIETKEHFTPNSKKQNLELKFDDDIIPSYYENLTVYSFYLCLFKIT